MIETPEIVQSEAQEAAVIHVAVPREEIQQVMGPGITEVMETLAAQGIEPAGPWYTYHLRMDPKVFDFEIGVPVKKAVAPAGRVKRGQLRAAKVARTVYQGPYEGLGDAWGELDGWIQGQGLKPAPDLWERYIAGPESSDDPTAYRTELNKPLVD
jgi:effector-binding domain-containing protein